MPDETIHAEVEGWLAADVHGQLTSDERTAWERHLSSCPACRALQQEEKNMHQLLDNTLAQESADPAFEQRMVRAFRDRSSAPNDGWLVFFSGFLRLRAAQVAALAALLLALVQVGKMVTGESAASRQTRSSLAFASPPALRDEKKSEPARSMASGLNLPAAEGAGPNPTLEFRRDLVGQSAKPLPAAAPSSAAEPLQKEQDVEKRTDADVTGQLSNEVRPAPPPATQPEGRKLIRNAQLELEVVNFEVAILRLTSLAAEEKGFVATQSSSKLSNGKLQGTVVIKVLPENLDRFLKKARSLGELKNQTLGTDDVTKAYFDTDARLRNARRMEERLLEMLKTKTGKVSDLLQVEKELARVREQIEQMQGELKNYDALVQYATVTISLAEKDLNEPAAFLLRETANLSLFAPDVEKTFAEVKSSLTKTKAQIVRSTLERDNFGQATAHMTLLLAPEESDALIGRIKGMGRVQNFNVQTERVAQNGSGMSETAKVERDKVQLNLVISRTGEEQAVQQTSLRILTSAVPEKVAHLKAKIAREDGELRSSTFSRNPDGQEVANLTLRIPMKNYAALVGSFDQLGEVKDLSVQRNDQPGTTANPETAPAEISLQIYSAGQIVADETGLGATIRRTLGQGFAALMWSARMIGVALAFLAPWAVALGLVVWLMIRFGRRWKSR